MQKNFEILEVFCNLTGLRTQGEECHGFYIQPTKDLYVINDCSWTINSTHLQMIECGSSEKYLGLTHGLEYRNQNYWKNCRDGYNRLGRLL